jgi:hypothetical protein
VSRPSSTRDAPIQTTSAVPAANTPSTINVKIVSAL